MRPRRLDIARKAGEFAGRGELFAQTVSKSRRHGTCETPDEKVAMSYMSFVFDWLQGLARPAARMWAKTISSFKYMQISVELLPLQEPTRLDSYVLSEMRDKSSTDRPLLLGCTTPGGITPISSRRVRRKECTQIVSLNGRSQSALELQVPIVCSAWRRLLDGGQGSLTCQA